MAYCIILLMCMYMIKVNSILFIQLHTFIKIHVYHETIYNKTHIH